MDAGYLAAPGECGRDLRADLNPTCAVCKQGPLKEKTLTEKPEWCPEYGVVSTIYVVLPASHGDQQVPDVLR